MENPEQAEPPTKKQKINEEEDRPFHYKLLKKHLKKHTALFKEYERGVLLFSPQKREDKSLSQAVDLLNAFAQKKYPKENTSDKDNLKRLVCVDSGCLGIVAIAFNDELKVDPVQFIDSVFSDEDLKKHKTKEILKIVPVQKFCVASMDVLIEKMKELISIHFKAENAQKFAIQYRSRNNNTFSREDTIAAVAKLVKAPHSVDLGNPDVVIIIEVFKSAIGISISSNFNKYRKYNIQEYLKEKK